MARGLPPLFFLLSKGMCNRLFHARFTTLISPHLDSMCFTYSTILVIREQYDVGSMDDQCAISLILSLLTCGDSNPNVNLGLVGSHQGALWPVGVKLGNENCPRLLANGRNLSVTCEGDNESIASEV